MDYPAFLKNIETDIAIAPLEINDFNASKSNLKMLEYIICGFPGVYTDIDPYKKASMKAKTEQEMIDKIEFLIKNVDKRKEVWHTDFKTMEKDLFFEDHKKDWVNGHLKLFGKKL